MPETPDQWNDIKDGFLQKSSHGLMNGCVGALDGFFQKCNAPSKKEISNVISFYSGHYESYGLNCQALCDAKLCFMYFGVVAPGSTNDNIAFPQTHDLYRTINNLPRGLFIVGDAAYSSTEQVLVPFTGSQRDDKDQDAFNYYLSHLRIRIEMAFGRKFRVLKRNLECSYRTNARILMACAVLHNFIIENDCVSNDKEVFDNDDNNIVQMDGAPMGMSYLPTIPDSDFDFRSIQGISLTRMTKVNAIAHQGFERPIHNIHRNMVQLDSSNDNTNNEQNNRQATIDRRTQRIENNVALEFYHPN